MKLERLDATKLDHRGLRASIQKRITGLTGSYDEGGRPMLPRSVRVRGYLPGLMRRGYCIVHTVKRSSRNELRMRCALLGLLACLVTFLGISCSGATTKEQAAEPSAQPNIVFILTDDLDFAAAKRMPEISSSLIEEGVSFENAFVSYPLCCPSRATILTGLYAHNHDVRSNAPPGGGFQKFHSEGHEEKTIATRLQQSGYKTALFGRYLTEYPGDEGPTYVPPGWDEWYAKLDANNPYDYRINENGRVVSYGGFSERLPQQCNFLEYDFLPAPYLKPLFGFLCKASYGRSIDDFYTDVLSDQVSSFVERAAPETQPFFMYVAPILPHRPAIPATRHREAFPGVKAPRPPSFDEEDVSDKPAWIRATDRLSDEAISRIDAFYLKRLRSMLSVDDMVASLIRELKTTEKLDNTLIFFTSDNGFQQGEHRILNGKDRPYEESVHVPLFVRGPGVPAGSKVEKLALNTDFAPTFADLAGVSFQADGRSLVPLLRGEEPLWRSAILLEDYSTGADMESIEEEEEEGEKTKPADVAYDAIRTETHKYVEYENGETELYNLETDPYELESLHETADPSLVEDLKTRLDTLKSCSGVGCREAEDTP